MDKVCRLKGNKTLVRDGFSSANAAIEWVNEVKDLITMSVTPAIKKQAHPRDNGDEHFQ